jgi:solute carrier family 25 carnitine/acylcarnitine transporter 20/29
VPSYGLYFALYESSRNVMDALADRYDRPPYTALQQFLAGGSAGVASWFSVYPFDVVKSRIQATCWQHSPYAGWVDCMRRTVQLEGAGALVRGMSPSLVRAFAVNAAIFAVYESTLSALP